MLKEDSVAAPLDLCTISHSERKRLSEASVRRKGVSLLLLLLPVQEIRGPSDTWSLNSLLCKLRLGFWRFKLSTLRSSTRALTARASLEPTMHLEVPLA